MYLILADSAVCVEELKLGIISSNARYSLTH